MMLVLLGCDNDHCAQEVSYPLDMLRNFAGKAICEICYTDGEYGTEDWNDLPVIMPHDLTFYFPNQQPPEFKEYMEAQHDLFKKIDELAKVMNL
jgi:hypothetical protein